MAGTLRVLLVDPHDGTGLESALVDRGVEVVTAGSIDGAIDAIESAAVDVAVSALELPGGDVIDLIEAVRSVFDPGPPVVVYARDGDETAASEAVGAGAVDYLPDSVASETVAERVIGASTRSPIAPDFRRLFETSPVAIFVQDRDSIRYANPAAAAFFGEPSVAALVGTDPMTYVPAAEAEDARERIRQVIEEREGFEAVDVRMHAADGTERTALLAAAPIPIGGDPGIFVVVRDITERKRREETLAEFVTVVSHDLRNPLTVAQGRLELAQERTDPADFEQVAAALARMEDIVEGLLGLAREGRRVGEREPVKIETIARRAWATIESGAATLSVDPDLPSALADPSRLQQVFENLYRNAVEHAGEAPTIHVGPISAGFYVADDGPGMPTADLDRLSVSHAFGDDRTGFGLGIVGRIVAAHGWTAEIGESETGGVRVEVTGLEPVESS